MNRRARPKTVETVVTFLQMRHNPHLHVPSPSNFKVALMRAEKPTVHFYRYLYDMVGRNYYWVDRKKLNDEALAEVIGDELVEVYVAYLDGTPAGYFELDLRNMPEMWLGYFGIIPDYQGRGLGKWLLAEAVATAWTREPEVLKVETCTLDGPRALPLYQKFGFEPYERCDKVLELPRC